MYQMAPGGRVNVSPTEGGPFYGLAKIDAKSGAFTAQIKGLTGALLYEKVLTPKFG